MAISINPTIPVIAAQGVTADALPQPGTVVDAQVLKLLANNAVRIAIADLVIDVMSEIPLQVGQTLQLAVSRTPDGIRLAVTGGPPSTAASMPTDTATRAADRPVDAAAKPAPSVPSPPRGLNEPQALAVSVAAQAAATKQAGLSQLFADLGAASGVLPPHLQQAAAQLLARRPSLDTALSGDDIATALRGSGLFMEQTLASGAPPLASGGAMPDLKAALLVFRQLLSLQLDRAGSGPAPNAPAAATTMLGDAARPASAAVPRDTADAAVRGLTNPPPPPPLRGASPAAQAVAVASLAGAASESEVVHRLRDGADAAIARTTLLQIASLPERADALAARNDPTMPRWHFEIPFATPSGTAVAQFEIARDGGGSEAEPEGAKRIWRARFSLDVEPAGPVHALVSLSGETTSVRMWAERPATAGQLRAGAAQLSQALGRADLKAGDIVVRDGVPPRTATARAGYFLDRAS